VLELLKVVAAIVEREGLAFRKRGARRSYITTFCLPLFSDFSADISIGFTGILQLGLRLPEAD
jgi:hypothetical protein